jgi:hypothetical protein
MASASAMAHAAAAPARAPLARASRHKAVAPRSTGRAPSSRLLAVAALPLAAAARRLRGRPVAQLSAAPGERGATAGSADSESGEQQQLQLASAAWAAAAAAAAAAKGVHADAPAADLTLRAETDGASARVQRNALAACSRIFESALHDAPAEMREMVLLGKSKAELDLLVDWLHKKHTFTIVRRAASMRASGGFASQVCVWHATKGSHHLRRRLPLRTAQDNIEAVCTLAQDFHIPGMHREADAWLTANLKALSGGDASWPDGLAYRLDDNYRYEDEEEENGSTQYYKTVELANTFPFLTDVKDARLGLIFHCCFNERQHPDKGGHMNELEALFAELDDAYKQLAALNARGAEPRKDVVRCV